MANIFLFTGRLTNAAELTNHGSTKVGKVTLIRNEYAGKERDERKVAIQFTAFNGTAEALAEHAHKGDQLIVTARVENNNYQRDGEDVYGFNFVVDSFEFGAPGAEKREMLDNKKPKRG